MIHNPEILAKLKQGNAAYLSARMNPGDVSPDVRKEASENGQNPFAVVLTCSDSRVIPEAIFSCGIGELFVIRVAGNVVGEEELGSVQYAAGHLGSKVILVLGHTNCGAVDAAMNGGAEGYVKALTDEIAVAIGDEKDYYKACCRNAAHSAEVIREKLAGTDAVGPDTDVLSAIYDIAEGRVNWFITPPRAS